MLGRIALLLLLLASPALAQTSENPGPYNKELGALVTNSARPAGTVTTSSQSNTNWRGVVCTLYQTAHVGSPTVQFDIEQYDGASRSWFVVISSTVISTADNTPYPIGVYPDAGSINAPYPLSSVSLPLTWRVSQIIAGTSTPSVTGTIGCNLLR